MNKNHNYEMDGMRVAFLLIFYYEIIRVVVWIFDYKK